MSSWRSLLTSTTGVVVLAENITVMLEIQLALDEENWAYAVKIVGAWEKYTGEIYLIYNILMICKYTN